MQSYDWLYISPLDTPWRSCFRLIFVQSVFQAFVPHLEELVVVGHLGHAAIKVMHCIDSWYVFPAHNPSTVLASQACVVAFICQVIFQILYWLQASFSTVLIATAVASSGTILEVIYHLCEIHFMRLAPWGKLGVLLPLLLCIKRFMMDSGWGVTIISRD